MILPIVQDTNQLTSSKRLNNLQRLICHKTHHPAKATGEKNSYIGTSINDADPQSTFSLLFTHSFLTIVGSTHCRCSILMALNLS